MSRFFGSIFFGELSTSDPSDIWRQCTQREDIDPDMRWRVTQQLTSYVQ